MLFSFGGHYLGIPSTLEGAVRFFGVSIPYQRLLILVVAVVMLVFCWFVLYRTRHGLAIRATANDLEVANLMGMNVNRIAMVTVAISVALAAVAGVGVAPGYVGDPFMWLAPLGPLLGIVVLGGPGSLQGSPIGALSIGDLEVANLMGMNVNRIAMVTVAISVALAAVAGVVVAPVYVVDPFMWLAPLVTMLAIVVLGGLGSLKGSLIGALIIGYVEAITVFAVPAGAYH